ncbi:hypothetical protein [Paenibacillus harenae]|uniref:hypothetical protein n=1 Tax=Paenibacillus harenae TaxID=306543 RepID=UPI00278CF442|nr:hypothetical protein [Paenibacillus harenae]MDQ0062345.1 hypothetical protein [Paenibacillus harenae]
MDNKIAEIKEALIKDHELYLSVGLYDAMQPSQFKEVVDSLLSENIPYMQSWGTHTKDEYIDIIDSQFEELKRLRAEHAAMKTALEWYAPTIRYSCDWVDPNDPDYPYPRTPEVYGDAGKRARQVLSTLQCPTE